MGGRIVGEHAPRIRRNISQNRKLPRSAPLLTPSGGDVFGRRGLLRGQAPQRYGWRERQWPTRTGKCLKSKSSPTGLDACRAIASQSCQAPPQRRDWSRRGYGGCRRPILDGLTLRLGYIQTGGLALSSPPLQPATPPHPVWWEIGRPSPEEAADWITWVAPLGDRGAALYRTLVVADGSVALTVEFHRRRGSGQQIIYRGRCGLQHDPEPAAERISALLKAADGAVSKALQAGSNDDDITAEHGRGSSYLPAIPQGTQQGRPPARGHDPEHYLRERAYFLWEREGRPEGRALEFWERAFREEARAA
ncbi:MAG: hypothetical protein AVDCRST_MAG27-3348 [uncultured Craurococcus sp.]|uniref:DUF2934 domain-containing protein n=1 Tax=uncultured Craurococcus sp. TaxID=1135998 RepID=A0A6J4IYR6_9PROT|nr:MAG: hypothetical protein AVDCRST_MAG27-3348 [uncultured Craurococcus sp.]